LIDSLATLGIAALVLLGSPGPATMSLAAVGGSVGFANGVPYLVGILTGLVCAMAGAVLGVAAIFVQWPQVKLIVQVVGAIYLAYISYKIAFAPINTGRDDKTDKLPNFRDGVILNVLNPKLYAGFFVLFSQFLLPIDAALSQYLATGGVMLLIAIAADTTWLAAGSSIQAIFAHPRYARPIRVLFGASIIIATIWALLPAD
jgi:threonine/homoserine/homoserine lactone efflux protein